MPFVGGLAYSDRRATVDGNGALAVASSDRTRVISVTPVVEATPDYSDGDVMGGKMSILGAARAEGGTGKVEFMSISSKVDITVALRVLFFKANPNNTTFTENGALSIHASDIDKLLGAVEVAAADFSDTGTPEIATKNNLNIPFELPTGTTLYAVCQAAGTINLGSTSDLTFNFGIKQD